jgi:glycosyltransferase involved in cell wall biosynthesis
MKILLLTDMPPCRNFTAGLVLERLVSFLQPNELALCAVINPALHPEIPRELDSVPRLLLRKPLEAAARVIPGSVPSHRIPRILRTLSGFPAFIFELVQAARVRYLLLPRIATFAREQGVDAIWVVLQGQTMIRLAKQLSEKLGLPLLTQVWDPFEWWLRANRVDLMTQRRLLATFDSVIRHSRGCAAASWAMAEAYKKKYSIHSVPVIAGLPAELAYPPADEPHRREEFVIGMAGQFYSQAEWACLICALDSVNWRLSGRSVKVRVLGGGFQAYSQRPTNFEYLGWHSQGDAIRLLADTDLLYMPYWFSEEFRIESSLSFPSKLVTYFAAGRPVFCHAPGYASPARYIREHEAGYCCESLDPPAVVGLLNEVLTDDLRYGRYAKHGSACLKRDFTLSRMQESFFDFLSAGQVKSDGTA